MDHQDNAHGEHGEHGAVHLPDPSIWPLVAGVAALVLGAALVYFSGIEMRISPGHSSASVPS